MIKLLVCGGRDYRDRDKVYETLDGVLKRNKISLLIVGYNPKDSKYQGADQLAYEWARDRKVGSWTFPADWLKHKKAAGPIRNREMRDVGKPSHAIAFPGGTGTAGMVKLLAEVGIKAWEIV